MKFALGALAYLTTVSSIIGLATVVLMSSWDRPAGASIVAFSNEPQKLAVVEQELPPKLQMKPEPVAEYKPMVIPGEAARLRAEARKGAPQGAQTRNSERKTPRSSQQATGEVRERHATREARDAFASSELPVEAPRPFVKEHRVY